MTGVRASAVTNARITVSPSNNTDDKHVLAFDLYGMNTDSVKVSATIGLEQAMKFIQQIFQI